LVYDFSGLVSNGYFRILTSIYGSPEIGTLFTSVKNTLKLQENLSEDFQRIFKEFFKKVP